MAGSPIGAAVGRSQGMQDPAGTDLRYLPRIAASVSPKYYLVIFWRVQLLCRDGRRVLGQGLGFRGARALCARPATQLYWRTEMDRRTPCSSKGRSAGHRRSGDFDGGVTVL